MIITTSAGTHSNCRWCGGNIPGRQIGIVFGSAADSDHPAIFLFYRFIKPTLDEEVKTLFPKYNFIYSYYNTEGYIKTAMLESNVPINEFFCSDSCAISLAHYAAREHNITGPKGKPHANPV